MEIAVRMTHRSKRNYLILGSLIVLCFILYIGLKVIVIGKGSLFQRKFNFDDNAHIQMLEELNKEWELPEGYTIDDIEYNGLNMNWVYPKDNSSDNVILQLHGGAYQRSLAENGTNYQRFAVKYAQISEARVLTIDYRVAPKHPYPAALEDAVMAYQWLLDQGYKAEKIIIVGDSAGGGLTLATALYLRDNDLPLPAALITMSAWTKLDYKRMDVPYVGSSDPKDPYISPFYGEYSRFPPILMQVGGEEALLGDTLEVADKALIAGVDITQTTYKDMFHVFQLLYPLLPEANNAWVEVEEFIDRIFNHTDKQ
ncbi:alpha/beta hydrolase [Mobilitalea sibirica]|uniref:Alpha/beta hydrolase n=1 Tax=Mobilitalea sibirica TaxID=1462919 RepID=A0A8J7L220_9FIRM|nr:alpha/beta hydrolase [Mobilitalea sibirica]MBH1939818.1 alpha/beta hydrolase [Mobilitalea sibirica]